MDVTIPANTTALVSVPGTDPGKVGELGSGRALLAKNAPGVSLVGVENGAVVFRVGSGDYRFVVGPGLFAATEVPGTVGGTVPPTLSLTLGPLALFGAFTPGVDRTYEASTTANVVSTAADAALSVSDPAPSHERVIPAAATAAGGDDAGVVDGAGVERRGVDAFKQPIGANEPLRTGVYSRTLTFTLSTTNP